MRRSVNACLAVRCSAVILMGTLGIAGAGAAPSLDAQGVLQRLQDWLDGTREIEGRFEQALVSGALGAGLEERGRLYILRPGWMRWDYVEPERKVAIVRDDRTWLYVEEERQLILGRLGEQGEMLPALLAGNRPLAELFEPTLESAPSGDGAYRLELRPRAGTETLQRITLTVRPPRFAIEAAEVLDPAGNQILYRFAGLRRNRGLPENVFDFEPPPGTIVAGSH